MGLSTINWNYGSHIAPGNVWGYPEIVYGMQGNSFEPPNGTHPANWGEQIGTGHFNITWDIGLMGKPTIYRKYCTALSRLDAEEEVAVFWSYLPQVWPPRAPSACGSALRGAQLSFQNISRDTSHLTSASKLR
jgi:hypothetical protein